MSETIGKVLSLTVLVDLKPKTFLFSQWVFFNIPILPSKKVLAMCMIESVPKSRDHPSFSFATKEK